MKSGKEIKREKKNIPKGVCESMLPALQFLQFVDEAFLRERVGIRHAEQFKSKYLLLEQLKSLDEAIMNVIESCMNAEEHFC